MAIHIQPSATLIDDRLLDQLKQSVGVMGWDDPVRQGVRPSVVSPAEVLRFRERYGHAAASLLIHSITLQHKAREKLGPGTWWVTPRGLEQSTAWQVARIKADWFNTAPVADLCCGIGGDSLWLARRGPLIGVDTDPTMVEIASANLAQSQRSADPWPQAAFVADEAIRQWNRCREVAVHIDPDRRPDQKRQTAPDHYSPSWTEVVSMISRAPTALVKLAPAAVVDLQAFDRPTHRCWISLKGSVREQSLLVGDAVANAGLPQQSRSAIGVRSDGSWQRFVADETLASATVVLAPCGWLIDPDPAIRAGGLSDTFACQHRLKVVGGPSGFLTADEVPGDLAMATHEPVEWLGACDARSLKQSMRRHDVFPARTKVRGVDRDPALLTKQLKDCGSRPVTLWLGRVGNGAYAAWTTPRAQPAD